MARLSGPIYPQERGSEQEGWTDGQMSWNRGLAVVFQVSRILLSIVNYRRVPSFVRCFRFVPSTVVVCIGALTISHFTLRVGIPGTRECAASGCSRTEGFMDSPALHSANSQLGSLKLPRRPPLQHVQCIRTIFASISRLNSSP